MTDIDRMTSPDSEPVDRVYAPGDPTDTENVEDAGPPHPQGTDKLSPEGNPA